MKILLLTQYFPPEVGAPQNRLFELAVRLQKMGADITILTAMPNYPQMVIHEAYQGKKYHFEMMSGLKVHRASIYVTQKRSIVHRLLNYFSFVYSSFRAARKIKGDFDYIFCESPPLFLGITAWLLKKRKKAKLIFNVSDLWPESAEKLGLVTNRLFLKIATYLEEFLYRHSELITGQTQGIVNNIQCRFPQKTLYWLPNGVDLGIYDVADESGRFEWRDSCGFGKDDFLLLYAGIIGHAQGLEVILRAAALLKDQKQIKFILLGSGPEKEMLMNLKKELGTDQVHFLDAVPKPKMPAIVGACDVAVVPLKRLDIFKGAIPSKIFENLAMKKPILLGVEGEAEDLFIKEGMAGLAFIPEDARDLAEKVMELYKGRERLEQLGKNGYAYVQQKFTRDLIAEKFWKFLNDQEQKKHA